MANRPTIAVVDDDESVRKALCRLLTALDFEANAFASGEAFLASFGDLRPDCVLLDIRMSGVDGFAVAERLAGQSEPVPFIFVTAHSGQENRYRAAELGAVALLKKPASEREILDAVHQALGSTTGS